MSYLCSDWNLIPLRKLGSLCGAQASELSYWGHEDSSRKWGVPLPYTDSLWSGCPPCGPIPG